MSLAADSFFFRALSQSDAVTDLVGNRIANPGLTYDEEDTMKVPYIIVMLDEVVNDSDTKDDVGESMNDRATVSIQVVADDRPLLAALARTVRSVILQAFRDGSVNTSSQGFTLDDYNFSAGQVEIDPDKACCSQTLRYVCDTTLIDSET